MSQENSRSTNQMFNKKYLGKMLQPVLQNATQEDKCSTAPQSQPPNNQPSLDWRERNHDCTSKQSNFQKWTDTHKKTEANTVEKKVELESASKPAVDDGWDDEIVPQTTKNVDSNPTVKPKGNNAKKERKKMLESKKVVVMDKLFIGDGNTAKTSGFLTNEKKLDKIQSDNSNDWDSKNVTDNNRKMEADHKEANDWSSQKLTNIKTSVNSWKNDKYKNADSDSKNLWKTHVPISHDKWVKVIVHNYQCSKKNPAKLKLHITPLDLLTECREYQNFMSESYAQSIDTLHRIAPKDVLIGDLVIYPFNEDCYRRAEILSGIPEIRLRLIDFGSEIIFERGKKIYPALPSERKKPAYCFDVIAVFPVEVDLNKLKVLEIKYLDVNAKLVDYKLESEMNVPEAIIVEPKPNIPAKPSSAIEVVDNSASEFGWKTHEKLSKDTWTKVLVHLVYSTKNKIAITPSSLYDESYKYLETVTATYRNKNCEKIDAEDLEVGDLVIYPYDTEFMYRCEVKSIDPEIKLRLIDFGDDIGIDLKKAIYKPQSREKATQSYAFEAIVQNPEWLKQINANLKEVKVKLVSEDPLIVIMKERKEVTICEPILVEEKPKLRFINNGPLMASDVPQKGLPLGKHQSWQYF